VHLAEADLAAALLDRPAAVVVPVWVAAASAGEAGEVAGLAEGAAVVAVEEAADVADKENNHDNKLIYSEFFNSIPNCLCDGTARFYDFRSANCVEGQIKFGLDFTVFAKAVRFAKAGCR
jgi:hypothetical protein